MAKALKAVFCTVAKASSSKCSLMSSFPKQTGFPAKQWLSPASNTSVNSLASMTRGHATLASVTSKQSTQTLHSTSLNKSYSTEVEKEISKFLEKEIQFETSRSPSTLPKITGFEIATDGGDLTLYKHTGSEKVVVKLSVNGAVDSLMPEGQDKQNEPPQMVCRPPFDVEISKGDGTVLAFQCSFPAPDESFQDGTDYGKGDQEMERIDDQFEIQEVAMHAGEWKDTTFTVSAATMDAELFDLLMDMLDERGINDEFIGQLVEFCTAYENQQYIQFLNKLKAVVEK